MTGPDTSERRIKRRARWRLWARRLLHGLGAAAGLMVVLLCAGLLAIHTGPFERWLRTRIEQRVGEHVRGRFAIGSLDLVWFGNVKLRHVTIADAQRREVVALDTLDLRIDYGKLLGGELRVERLAIDGLRLQLERDEHGKLNLDGLFELPPPEPSEEPASEPPDVHLRVAALHLGEVHVTLREADSTRLALEHFSLDGSIDASPASSTVRIELPRITASLTLDKPAQGLTASVKRLCTGLSISLEHGAGTAELLPTHARASVARRGAPLYQTDIDLQPLRVELGRATARAELGRLMAGALTLESLHMHGGARDGALYGEQQLELVDLRISARRLNALLGKKLLASDITVAISTGGPPEAVQTAASVQTAGGRLDLGGALDLSDATRPGYDLSLLATDLRSDKLLLAGDLPPALLEHLRVGARGSGSDLHTAEIDLALGARHLEVQGHTINEVLLAARLDGGVLRVDPLMIAALGNRLWLRGWIDVDGGAIDAEVTIEGDVGATLQHLRQAGMKLSTRLPPGALRLSKGTVTAHLSGDLQGLLRAEIGVRDLAIAGGTVMATGRAALLRGSGSAAGEGAMSLQSMRGAVELRNLGLRQLAALAGKRLEDVTGSVSAKLAVEGSADAPQIDCRVQARVQPTGSAADAGDEPTVLLTARGHGTRRDLSLALDVEGRHGPSRIELLSATAKLPLLIDGKRRGLAPNRPLHVELLVPRRSLSDLLPYLPRRLRVDPRTGKPRHIPLNALFVRAALDGTPARPEGIFDVDLYLRAMGNQSQRLSLTGSVAPAAGAVRVGTDIEGWLDPDAEPALEGRAELQLSRSPLLGGALDSWSLDLHLMPQDLSGLPLPQARLLGLHGSARADIDLHGSRTDLLGTVGVSLTGVRTSRIGPIDAEVKARLAPTALALDTDVKVDGTAVLRGRGGLARGGRGLLTALRTRPPGATLPEALGNPALRYQLTLPTHPLATFGAVNPKVAGLPGLLDGTIAIGGHLAAPIATGAVRYHDFPTLGGSAGEVRLGLEATATSLGVALDLGAPTSPDRAAPITLTARLPRAALPTYLAARRCHAAATAAGSDKAEAEIAQSVAPCQQPAALPISLQARADAAPLERVLPAFALAHRDMQLSGKLDWTLDGDLVLDPKPRYAEAAGTRVRLPPVSPGSTVRGKLALRDGLVSIPGTRRKYHDVTVRLHHDAQRLAIDALSLRESDLQHQGRKLDLRGALDLDHGRPRALELDLDTDQWLLFGHEKLGPADAPRGTLTMHAKVRGDLIGTIKKVDVDVDTLELLIPNRFRRAHQPEEASTGDVIFLDESGQPAGKLPVPPAVAARAKARANETTHSHQAGEANAGGEAGAPATDAAPPGGLDLRVRMAHPVHVLQYPMDLYATGGIAVSRRGARRHIDGTLEVVKGDLSLGGRKHRIVKGRLVFSDEAPGGFLDLLFARREHNASLRGLSEASAGKRVTIRLEGPIVHRETTLGGAGSPGTLYDLLAIHNAGRPRYHSAPDLPASFTVDYPQHLNLLLLSYLSVNVPHLLFLDRIDAWADAYDERGSAGYGRMRHYDAEVYNESETLRLRAAGRPRGAGQSTAEIDLDWLWASTPQVAVGAGLGAGSRLGGGPGLFVEWSSKD